MGSWKEAVKCVELDRQSLQLNAKNLQILQLQIHQLQQLMLQLLLIQTVLISYLTVSTSQQTGAGIGTSRKNAKGPVAFAKDKLLWSPLISLIGIQTARQWQTCAILTNSLPTDARRHANQ